MIYKGLKYPFGKGVNKFPADSTDNDVIRESILQIIQTRTGSRVMRPDFGCKIEDYIFDNSNSLMCENIKLEVIRAISLFEPRARIISVDVSINEEDNSLIDITITYETNFSDNNKIQLFVSNR